MIRKLYKRKLLLDENFPPRRRLPKLNQLYDVKHVSLDLRLGGMEDEAVYDVAQQQSRLLVTFNFPDFQHLPTASDTAGVFAVSGNLADPQIDTKLVSYLRKTSAKSLYGRATYISGETRT